MTAVEETQLVWRGRDKGLRGEGVLNSGVTFRDRERWRERDGEREREGDGRQAWMRQGERENGGDRLEP